ncbi:MAG: glycosyltransferase [Runella sp.]
MLQNAVCVLIPHFNQPDTLTKSIASIGPDEKVDVLIIDDGSRTPLDEETIKSFARFKGQIFFFYFAQNQGLGTVLNEGCRWIQARGYRYIGRLDCGDTCHEKRFEIQHHFLENAPEIGLVGSWVVYQNQKGEEIMKLRLPTDPTTIQKYLPLYCPFVHPAVMFRVKVLQKVNYDPQLQIGEDYAFYYSLARYFPMANLPLYLLHYQVDDNSISEKSRQKLLRQNLLTQLQNFQMGIYPIAGILKTLALFLFSRKQMQQIRKILLR